MRIDVSFHNVDHSAALEHFIRSKSVSLRKFLEESDHLRWSLCCVATISENELIMLDKTDSSI